MTPKERLKHIIEESYFVLMNKIASGGFTVSNEANMQHEFGLIIKSIGSLYEFTMNDKFVILMEFNVCNQQNATSKTSGTPRCDIFLTMKCGRSICTAAIELKYFPYNKGGEAVTDNKFAVYQDIENLQSYKADLKYEILYTDNPNYSIPKSDVKYSIANTIKEGTYEYSNKRPVIIAKDYEPEWTKCPLGKASEHYYFMKVEFK